MSFVVLHCPAVSFFILCCPSLSFVALRRPSSFLIVLNRPSLSFVVLHCPSLSCGVRHCPQLSCGVLVLSFIAVRCRSLFFIVPRCPSLPFVVLRCTSLSFVVLRCPSLSFVALHYASLSFVALCCPSLPFIVLRCPSWSFVVLRRRPLSFVVLRCPWLSFVVLHCPSSSFIVLRCPSCFFDVLRCPSFNPSLSFVVLRGPSSSFAPGRSPNFVWICGVLPRLPNFTIVFLLDMSCVAFNQDLTQFTQGGTAGFELWASTPTERVLQCSIPGGVKIVQKHLGTNIYAVVGTGASGYWPKDKVCRPIHLSVTTCVFCPIRAVRLPSDIGLPPGVAVVTLLGMRLPLFVLFAPPVHVPLGHLVGRHAKRGPWCDLSRRRGVWRAANGALYHHCTRDRRVGV